LEINLYIGPTLITWYQRCILALNNNHANKLNLL